MSELVLVTGGGGFIGSNLCRALLESGVRVRVLDNFSTGRRENLAEIAADVEVVEGDILSENRVASAMAGCAGVYHQAAMPSVPRSVQDPLASNAVNVTGTLNVLLAARDAGVRRVVAASSSSVYGANPELPKHERLQTLPMSPYAVAKLAAESYCASFSAVYELETVALRYFNVFGPLQDPDSPYAAVIPRFITALHEGQSPTVYGDGTQTRDFTYIDNVVAANVKAMQAPVEAVGQRFNIACGDAISLNDVLEVLREKMGSDLPTDYQPARTGDIKRSLADVSAARDVLGYEVTVPFDVGIERTIEHFTA